MEKKRERKIEDLPELRWRERERIYLSGRERERTYP